MRRPLFRRFPGLSHVPKSIAFSMCCKGRQFLWDNECVYVQPQLEVSSTAVSRCELSSFAYVKLGPRTAPFEFGQLEDGWDEPASINLLSLCRPMRRGGT
jgi:hypothetical protein